jgi:dienelactone hydrolase
MKTIRLAAVCSLFGVLANAQATSSAASRPLGGEASVAVMTFFAYDRTLPLSPRVADSSKTASYRREKIVFTGADGRRVPALLAVPTRATGPVPVVLALHAGAGSKEDWWQADSFEHGSLVTERLVASGIAVVSLDAELHGERAAASDFDSFRAMWFDKQWFSWIRNGLILTVRDYRRVLDYLQSRKDIDTSRVAVIGYSLGGIAALQLAAVEPRIRAVVSCVGGLDAPWLFPVAPINLAPALGRLPLLLIGGRTDPLVSEAMMVALNNAIEGGKHRMLFFASGHQLPSAYADSATAWLAMNIR